MVVIGDGAVGKTSLIKCYIHETFPEEHTPTVLDCYKTDLEINGQKLTVQIWDSAG